MMNNKLISVIVPVYNVRPYLKRCIDSIIAQTYSNLEILLVDDGSTDGSGELCDAYARQDARVQVIHKKNGGQASARNEALRRAVGDFICFADSDDYLDVRMIEVLHRDLTETNADAAVVGFQKFSDAQPPKEGRQAATLKCLTNMQAIQSILQTEEIGDFAWNKMYRRKLMEGFLYPEGRVLEDMGSTYLLLEKCQLIVYRPAELYYYYQRENSTLHLRKQKFYEDKWDMGCQRYRYIREKYPDMLENDAAMMKIVEHCYPYLRKDERRKAEMERFLQEFRTEAEGLLDSGFMRKYRLLKQSRGLYSALFLLKNGRAAK